MLTVMMGASVRFKLTLIMYLQPILIPQAEHVSRWLRCRKVLSRMSPRCCPDVTRWLVTTTITLGLYISIYKNVLCQRL